MKKFHPFLSLKAIFLTAMLVLLASCSSTSKDQAFKKSSYSPQRAYELMQLSDIAYLGTSLESYSFSDTARQVRLKEAIEKISPKNPFQLVWYASMDEGANLSFILERQLENRLELLIINRGTVFNLMNIVQDIDVYRQSLWRNQDEVEQAALSTGIAAALEQLVFHQGLVVNEKKQKTILEFIKDKKQQHPLVDIYIAGHSLGGAIASALGLWLYEELQDELEDNELRITTYSYGSQMLGNAQFAEYYNSLLVQENLPFQLFRVVNPFDAVVYAFSDIHRLQHLPYPFTPGAKFQLRSFGSLVGMVLVRQNYSHLGLKTYSLTSDLLKPKNCSRQVETLLDFACWAAFGHSTKTYLSLLKKQLLQ